LNVNKAFLERSDGPFKRFAEKLVQFGIDVITPKDFRDLFELNNEVAKAGRAEFQGLDLAAIDLEVHSQKLDEKLILDGIEPWKYSLIYSGVKNYRNSLVLVDPDDFDPVIESLNDCGDITLQDRRLLSLKALYRLLRIGSLTHKELSELFATEKFETLILEEITPLRYGENPHQFAYIAKIAKEKAFFDFVGEDTLGSLSYNNLIDLHLAMITLKHLGEGFVVHVHHGTIVDARKNKFHFDGARGVVVADFVNSALISALKKNDLDVVALPDVSKVKARKTLKINEISIPSLDKSYRYLHGNFIVQTPDDLEDMRFFSENNDSQYRWANVIAALSNSMSCCIFKGDEMISLGSGQPDQIDALEIALKRAERNSHTVKGAVFAFDGPIKDMKVIETLKEIGIGTIIEPGGVKEDKEIKKALENSEMKLIFSRKRRYKH